MHVRLLFPNSESLWQFSSFLPVGVVTLDLERAILEADLDAAEVELVIHGFGAISQNDHPGLT